MSTCTTPNTHGIKIGLERINDTFFLKIAPKGKLTHDDYQILTPMLDNALSGIAHPSINVLLDGRKLEGWEARAAWDDFKLGVKHGKKFDKVAIVGNRHWQENAAKVANWFVAGEVQFFDGMGEAHAWLV